MKMSKTKVVYKSEKFFVNKEKKTVACTIDFEINLLEIKALKSMLYHTQFRDLVSSLSYDKENAFGICKFKVSGKARATDEDEFDEEFGKRLAKTRAQKNAFKIANKVYCDIGEFLYKLVLKDIDTFVNGSGEALYKCINHENKLIDEKFHLNN